MNAASDRILWLGKPSLSPPMATVCGRWSCIWTGSPMRRSSSSTFRPACHSFTSSIRSELCSPIGISDRQDRLVYQFNILRHLAELIHRDLVNEQGQGPLAIFRPYGPRLLHDRGCL